LNIHVGVELIEMLALLAELALELLQLQQLLLTDVELLAGSLTLGEGITGSLSAIIVMDPTISFLQLQRRSITSTRARLVATYPPRSPPGREAPEPVSPAAMARIEVDR
jgi:hypothetical protein